MDHSVFEAHWGWFCLIQSKHVANFGTENSSPILHQFFGMYQTVIKSIIFFKDFCSEKHRKMFGFFKFYHLPIIFLPSKKIIILNSKQGGLNLISCECLVHQPWLVKTHPILYLLSTKHQRWRVHAWQTLNVFLKTNDDVRLGDLGVPLAMSLGGKNLWSWGVLIRVGCMAFCGCYVKETIVMLWSMYDDGIGLMYD